MQIVHRRYNVKVAKVQIYDGVFKVDLLHWLPYHWLFE